MSIAADTPMRNILAARCTLPRTHYIPCLRWHSSGAQNPARALAAARARIATSGVDTGRQSCIGERQRRATAWAHVTHAGDARAHRSTAATCAAPSRRCARGWVTCTEATVHDTHTDAQRAAAARDGTAQRKTSAGHAEPRGCCRFPCNDEVSGSLTP
jgi:hypothetical protein